MVYHAQFAIDGILQPPSPIEIFSSLEADHPWFRVNIGTARTIKGARILVRSGMAHRLAFTEDDLSFDCINPLVGSVVSVQKFGHMLEDHVLEISEIFLEAYCGPLNTSFGDCQFGDLQHIDQCALKEQFKGTHLATVTEKQSWTATSVPVVAGSWTAMLDGIRNGSFQERTVFATPSLRFREYHEYPWVQVDFSVEKVVKGVHLYSRTDSFMGLQIRFIEVRIGNTDAGSITPLGKRICANALCLNTGGGEMPIVHANNCSGGPLRGRYVTLQRHLPAVEAGYAALVIAELDVEFYNA